VRVCMAGSGSIRLLADYRKRLFSTRPLRASWPRAPQRASRLARQTLIFTLPLALACLCDRAMDHWAPRPGPDDLGVGNDLRTRQHLLFDDRAADTRKSLDPRAATDLGGRFGPC